jgi:hypothetical protein
MPERDEMVAVVEEYQKALSAGDLDGVMALYAPDAVLEDPIGTEPKTGHAAIRDFYASVLAMKPQAELMGPVAVWENHAACTFRMRLQFGEDEASILAAETSTAERVDGELKVVRFVAVPDLLVFSALG